MFRVTARPARRVRPACAHACPQKAIALTVPEKNPNARYRNEHVSLQEIIRANHQPSNL